MKLISSACGPSTRMSDITFRRDRYPPRTTVYLHVLCSVRLHLSNPAPIRGQGCTPAQGSSRPAIKSSETVRTAHCSQILKESCSSQVMGTIQEIPIPDRKLVANEHECLSSTLGT
jgi:hypothetical protein